MKSKYVFLDIDGTLVNFRGEAPVSAIEALGKAHENGHKLIICTGRQQSQVYPWLLEKVSFDGVIASSGANIRAGKITVAKHCLSHDKLSFLSKYFRNSSTPYCIQTQDALMLEKWCSDMIVGYYEKQGIGKDKINSLFGKIEVVADAASLTDAEKIVYYNSPKDTDGVAKDIGDFFQVVRYSFGNAASTSGEITCRQYNKATGMEEILAFLGGDRADTIAIGDGDNDLEMIEYAAVGVAMGNATPLLKSAADMHTDDIDSDGIAKAFSKLGLI